VRRPRRRTVGIAQFVVIAVVGWLWYTQPQPVLPEVQGPRAKRIASEGA
jgi:hypothetical protein